MSLLIPEMEKRRRGPGETAGLNRTRFVDSPGKGVLGIASQYLGSKRFRERNWDCQSFFNSRTLAKEIRGLQHFREQRKTVRDLPARSLSNLCLATAESIWGWPLFLAVLRSVIFRTESFSKTLQTTLKLSLKLTK